MEAYASHETLLAQEDFRRLLLWSAGAHVLVAAWLVWSPVFRSSSIEPAPVFVQVMDAPRAPAAPAAKPAAAKPVSKPAPPAPKPAPAAKPAPARQKVDEVVLPAKPKELPKSAPKPNPPAPTAQELLDRMRAKVAQEPPPAPTAQELLDRMRARAAAQEQAAPRANAPAAAVDPAAGAAAASGGAGRFDPEMAAYHRKIQTMLYANWVGANQFRHQPELRASFEVRVQPDGRIRAVRLVRSSGNRFYDESAERAILKSEPLPNPPRGEITLSLTFNPMEIL
jgi:colicin import membrane protein